MRVRIPFTGWFLSPSSCSSFRRHSKERQGLGNTAVPLAVLLNMMNTAKPALTVKRFHLMRRKERGPGVIRQNNEAKINITALNKAENNITALWSFNIFLQKSMLDVVLRARPGNVTGDGHTCSRFILSFQQTEGISACLTQHYVDCPVITFVICGIWSKSSCGSSGDASQEQFQRSLNISSIGYTSH